ncbi:MAG: hypothetical protein IRY95_04380 [Clostridia bacterium]|nr:hypothetical protein [Clostridia bacterium]
MLSARRLRPAAGGGPGAAAVRAELPTGVPVDVFAHSLGGLVVRAWVEVCGGAEQVERAFFLATPHEGTPIVPMLPHGDPCPTTRPVRPHDACLERIPPVAGLRPGSSVIRALAQADRVAVRYYAVAGVRQGLLPRWLWSLSMGESDGLVPVRSAASRTLDRQTSRPVTRARFPIGHVGMPAAPQVRAWLLRQVSGSS